MRWAFLSLLVVVAGAVAAFAIYTWGWREEGMSESEERKLAEVYAAEVAATCQPVSCDVEDLEPTAPGVWRFRSVEQGGGTFCVALHLEDFRVLAGGDINGFALVPC